jgi:hypothetical protein
MEMMINNELVDCAKLNGVCFGKRGDKQHIKIWSSTVQMAVQAIIDQLQDVCEELETRHMKITFISFKDLNSEKISQANAEGFLMEDEVPDIKYIDSPAPRGRPHRERNYEIAAPAPPGSQEHQAVGMAILLGLAYLLGLLANDMVFDAAPLPICRAYHCALLDSLMRFPQVLRVVTPVLIIGGGLIYRITTGMYPLTKVYDIASAILLGVGGSVAFFNTTQLAGEMCAADLTKENMDTVATMRDHLIPWHLFLGGAMIAALALQIVKWRKISGYTKFKNE